MHRPGTTSSLKQLLQNAFMKRIVEYHSCQCPIYYCAEKGTKTRECNHLIYTYIDEKYEIYKIIQKYPSFFMCLPHGRFNYSNTLTPELDWSAVGVFTKGPMSSETETVRVYVGNIRGKVITVENVLITCPINVLTEK